MTITTDQQSPQLIEPPTFRRRRIVAIVIILIVIIGLIISFLIQPFGDPDSQQGNVFGGLGWIAQIMVSFILLLASVVQLTGYSIRDLFSSRAAKTSVEDFPFYVIQEYDKLLDYLFPDPKTPLISDRKIKYLPQISSEADTALRLKGMVLIRGRSKTGKTREACELLRRWWYSGPTILVVKSNVRLYPPFKIPENLPIRNLVLVFDDIDRYLGDSAAIKRLVETIQFFQEIVHDRGELRVIATARQEEEFWEKLSFNKNQSPWNNFELIQLNPLSPEKAQEVITELSKMSGITIDAELVKNLAEKNDGTFLNLALTFRSWLSQNIKAISSEDIHGFDGALKTTWRKRYEELAISHPDIRPVYATIDFMQSHDLPLRPTLIRELATEMGLGKKTFSLLGLFDRLQNWFDMSPLFNWYRDPKRRKKGWLIICLTGILITYLLLYVFLRFASGNIQFWFFDGLSEKLSFQIICLLPIWIPLIPFTFYSIMIVLRNLAFRRIGNALNILLATEVPMRGGELRPYENQFDGHGSTTNWTLQNYSGEIHEPQINKNALQRLSNRYIFLAEQFRLNGEFSAAHRLAILAQKILPDHPAPLFMLGKIDVDEGRFRDAIGVLRVSQNLYRGSSNASYVQERYALSCFFLGEYENVEQTAEKALKEMPRLITARWALGLAQLKQDKISIGQENCLIAQSLNQPIPVEIKRAMDTVGMGNKFNIVNTSVSTNKFQKWLKIFADRFALLILIIAISITFIVFVPYFNALTEKGESGVPLMNALLSVFPKSPVLFLMRCYAYEDLGKYDKAIEDCTEAIRIDPKFVNAYISLGENYYYLRNYDEAIERCTEALRLELENVRAYHCLGNAYNDLENYEKAIENYNIEISINPFAPWSYRARGEVYNDLGEFQKAVTDFNRSIGIDPYSAFSYANRGYAYDKLGEYDKAISDCTEAIRLDPAYAFAYNCRGSLYNELGQYEQAIADLSEAIRLDPNFADVYNNRGIAYRHIGEYEKAIADYNEAIHLDPKSAVVYNNRAIVYQALGRQAEANADFQKYKELTGQP